jgi:hypothetical protein
MHKDQNIDYLFPEEWYNYSSTQTHIFRYPRLYKNLKGYESYEQLPSLFCSADPEKHYKHKSTIIFDDKPVSIMTFDGRILTYENYEELLDFYSSYKYFNKYKLHQYLKGQRSFRKDEKLLPFVLCWYSPENQGHS